MADDKGTPKAAEVQLTWQQKLEKGLPLNALEEVKADADFNYRQRLREEDARREFEARKNQSRDERPSVDPSDDQTSDAKPLSKMTKKELLAVADDEDVLVDENDTNAALVEAIEAHRKDND